MVVVVELVDRTIVQFGGGVTDRMLSLGTYKSPRRSFRSRDDIFGVVRRRINCFVRAQFHHDNFHFDGDSTPRIILPELSYSCPEFSNRTLNYTAEQVLESHSLD